VFIQLTSDKVTFGSENACVYTAPEIVVM